MRPMAPVAALVACASLLPAGANAVQKPPPALTAGVATTPLQADHEHNSFQGVKHRGTTVLGGTSTTVTTAKGPVRVDRGWSNPNLAEPVATTQVAIDFMLSKVGAVPYQAGGTGNPGYDCSGLVQAAWRAAGKSLPRTSSDQFAATARVPLAQLRPGDLLFFGPGGSWHVSVYLGSTQLVHAANPTDDIEVSDMTYSWYAMNFYGAGRVT